MASSKRIGILIVNASGTPENNGTTPTLYWWDPADGSAFLTAPTLTAHGSGLYSFDPTLAADQTRHWYLKTDSSHLAVPAGGQVAYEDQQQPATLGGGSESVTLTITVDGGAMQGVRVEARSSGTLVAQGYTGVSGTIVLALDPGTYVVRCVRAGATFSETTVVVTDPDTATPSTIDGTSIASTAETPPGLTGSVAYTAPVYDGAIGPLAARDSWTLTRSVTSLPANIASARFTVQARGKTATSLVENTTTVTDSTSPTGAVQTVIDADDLNLSAGLYDYDWELTLADGSVRTIERGVLTVVGHPTP